MKLEINTKRNNKKFYQDMHIEKYFLNDQLVIKKSEGKLKDF
jgi:hypothetical protein